MIIKRALVTGAGRRLGQAMAISLGARGFDVAIHYKSSQAGAGQTLAAVQKAGGNGFLISADLANESDVATLVEKAEAGLGGPLGLLINNASMFNEDDFETHSRQTWDDHFEVNLRTPIALAQAFAKKLPTDSKGLIINIIDQRVWKLNPKFFTYTLTKSALWTATQTMAQALAPNIRVNGIGPGPTLSNERQQADDFKKQVEATLTQEGASPDEIVKALGYLIDAQSVTGQMIAVDGGQHLIWQTPDVDGVVE